MDCEYSCDFLDNLLIASSLPVLGAVLTPHWMLVDVAPGAICASSINPLVVTGNQRGTEISKSIRIGLQWPLDKCEDDFFDSMFPLRFLRLLRQIFWEHRLKNIFFSHFQKDSGLWMDLVVTSTVIYACEGYWKKEKNSQINTSETGYFWTHSDMCQSCNVHFTYILCNVTVTHAHCLVYFTKCMIR